MNCQQVTLAVVIPSYGRPNALDHCLAGLSQQQRPADEVIVVVRADDGATGALLDRYRTGSRLCSIREVHVARPGMVHALNAGLLAVRSDLVAFTDDDAVPRPPWLRQIEAAFAEPDIAAAGGRDELQAPDPAVSPGQGGWRRSRCDVGLVGRCGRVTGNHHLGTGGPREVDVLKGVNMAFRTHIIRAIGFDTRLKGPGAQVHNELSVCLPLRKAGWRLIYDPSAVVDHYLAVRPEGDHRQRIDRAKMFDATFNETLAVWSFLSLRWRVVYLLWTLLVGTLASPGIVQLPRLLVRYHKHGVMLLATSLTARRKAIQRAIHDGARTVLPVGEKVDHASMPGPDE